MTAAVLTRVDASAEAEQAIVEAQEVLASWVDRRDAAAAELADLEESLGRRVMEDPESEDDLVAQMMRLRGRVQAAEQAIPLQEQEILVAASAFYAAEADRLEQELAPAVAELDEHRAKAQRLLAELQDLEKCDFIDEGRHVGLLRAAIGDAPGGPTQWHVPRSQVLAQRLAVRRHSVTALRELAAGRPLQPLLETWQLSLREVLPESVYGPKALVPHADFLRSVERARDRVRDLEAVAQRLPAEITEWEAKQREARGLGGDRHAEQFTPGLQRRRAQLDEVGRELDQARAALAALTA